MVSIELLIVSILRALVEVAGMFLLGQGMLHVLAGASRENNKIYLLFRMLARPAVWLVRQVTPKAILDRHMSVVAFFVLFWLWIALAYLRRAICEANGLACG